MGQPSLLCCGAVCGGGVKREQCRLLGSPLAFSHFLCYSTSTLDPPGADFLGGCVCACSRILWVSPTNFPVRLGVSPAATTSTDFYSQRFWDFMSPPSPTTGTMGCVVCLAPQLLLPVYPHGNVGQLSLPAAASPVLSVTLLYILSVMLPVWVPPTGLDECFFFKSLVVGLPYNLTFWLFLFLNWLLSFWLCKEAKRIYLRLHLGWKS